VRRRPCDRVLPARAGLQAAAGGSGRRRTPPGQPIRRTNSPAWRRCCVGIRTS
jgi:hypothetical protein